MPSSGRSGYNGCYSNPDYIAKQRKAGFKRWHPELSEARVETLLLTRLPRTNKGPGHHANQTSFKKGHVALKPDSLRRKKVAGERFKRLNKDPEFIRKRLKALCRRPTKPEQQLIDLISEYRLPYKYTGDGSVIIGGLNPDFININGDKKIIEVFGRPWHQKFPRGWKQTELGRIMALSSYGFKTLIVWEEELEDQKTLLSKIRQFNRKG